MSAEQIDYTRITGAEAAFRIYNGGEVEIERDFNGMTFRFPPAHEDRYHARASGRPWPMACPLRRKGGEYWTACTEDHAGPGVTPIFEWGPQKNGAKAITAQQALVHFVGEDGRSGSVGIRGLRPLIPGGDASGENDAVRGESKRAWAEADYRDALATKVAHLDRNRKEREANMPPTAPSRRVMEAMEKVVRYETDRGGRLMPFSCPECTWPQENKRALSVHILKFHADAASKYGLTDGGEVTLLPGDGDAEGTVSELVSGAGLTGPAVTRRRKRGRPRGRRRVVVAAPAAPAAAAEQSD